MSKIDDLIAELCPEGVEFRELGELLGKVVGSNKKIVKSDIKSEGKYPVYTQGANQMPDGYSDDENNVVDDVPVILYGDHTNSLKWIDHEFIAGADGVKMIKTDLKYDISDKFLFHCMREQINLIPNDYARHFSKVRNLKIPLPPLAVQREIVDILDKFTQLEAELEAELEARKKQYEHYRNQLLTFGDNAEGVRWTTLGEVAKIKNGKDWKLLGTGNIPVYGTGGIMGFVDQFSYNKPTVLIPRKDTITNIFYLEGPFWNVDTIYYTQIDESQVIPKFFYYFMKTIDLIKLDTGSGRPSLTQAILDKIKIPIPPLAEQNRIVAILDKFDALTTDISTGLPAELTARRKQYEYYRGKLLTFEEKKGVASV